MTNAAILQNVLRGKKGVYRDTVLFNAGLGIFAAEKAATVMEGIDLAKESIDSGRAYETLQQFIKRSKREGIK